MSQYVKIRVFIANTGKYTVQKMKFSLKDFFSKCDQIRRKLRILVRFTEEILNGKLYFCTVIQTIKNSTFGNFSHGARYLLDLFCTNSPLLLNLLELRFCVLLKKRCICYTPYINIF